MPLTVTAMLATLRAVRRSRRPVMRSPSSIGTGSRAESVTSQARRFGGRTGAASELIVLTRAARTAGMNVPSIATSSATIMTRVTVLGRSPGDAPVPSRPVPGLVSSGATVHPVSSPATSRREL